MNCKNCGANAEDGQRYCPVCGEELNPKKEISFFDAGPADASAEQPSDHMGHDSAEQHIENDAVAVENEAPARKRTSKLGAIITAAVLVVAILAGLVGSGVINFNALQSAQNRTVATMGKYKLSNRDLAYYYWNQVYYLDNSYYNQYGITLDQLILSGVPFDEQDYYTDSYATWHDYFLEMAIENWVFTVAVAELAKNENHELNAVYADYINNFDVNTSNDAANYGFSSVDEMLSVDFGDSADIDSYRAFQEEHLLASSYSYSVYEAALSAQYEMLDMINAINIRHILIKTETAQTDEDIATFKQLAEEIYADWQLNPTEDYFAVLAAEYTGDTGSLYSGGLYENVAPGDMVTEFNDWCFAEGRQIGDSGIVETTFGFHIMYFSGYGEEQVPADATAAALAGSQAENEYMQWLNDLFESLDFDVKYDSIELAKNSF